MNKQIKGLIAIFSGFLCGCSQNVEQKIVEQNFLDLNDKAIYKIIPVANFEPSQKDDSVKLLQMDKDSGFIHSAYGNQVKKVIEKFFKDENELLLLELDENLFQQYGLNLKAEANKAGGKVYPHIYGDQKIPAAVIKTVLKLEKTDSDEWVKVENKEKEDSSCDCGCQECADHSCHSCHEHKCDCGCDCECEDCK